jgi:putative oxidoreductase
MRDIIDLIGRIFLSTIFIFEAVDSILYFDKNLNSMREYGFNDNLETYLYASIFLLVAGGLMVLFGYRSTLGSILLLCYWIPVTLVIHDFWNAPKDQLRIESILFMKDIAIIGGLLMLMGKGSGRYSVKRLLATTRVRSFM